MVKQCAVESAALGWIRKDSTQRHAFDWEVALIVPTAEGQQCIRGSAVVDGEMFLYVVWRTTLNCAAVVAGTFIKDEKKTNFAPTKEDHIQSQAEHDPAQ